MKDQPESTCAFSTSFRAVGHKVVIRIAPMTLERLAIPAERILALAFRLTFTLNETMCSTHRPIHVPAPAAL